MTIIHIRIHFQFRMPENVFHRRASTTVNNEDGAIMTSHHHSPMNEQSLFLALSDLYSVLRLNVRFVCFQLFGNYFVVADDDDEQCEHKLRWMSEPFNVCRTFTIWMRVTELDFTIFHPIVDAQKQSICDFFNSDIQMRRTRISIASCLCNELWRWAVGCVRDECRHLRPTIQIHSSSIVYLDQMRFNSRLRSSKFRESSTTTTFHSKLFALHTWRAFGERSRVTEAIKHILIASSSSLIVVCGLEFCVVRGR